MKLTVANAFDLATKVAELSTFDKYRLGCVLLDRHRNLLSVGFNQYKTHPKQRGNYGFLHAEVHAICKLSQQLTSTPYYAIVVRINRKGQLRLAKPCATCRMALKEAGVRRTYYTRG